jgi:hypothetical protein
MEVIVSEQNTKGFFDNNHGVKCTINASHESTEKTGATLKPTAHRFTYDITLVFCR